MKKNRVEEFIKNPKKAFYSISIPITVVMIVQSLYILVDTAFVGRLGAEAIAALTFSFPVFFILIALNAGLGAGVGSRISRYLGEKKKKDAENTAIHGILISLILALVIVVLGQIFLDPLLSLFGATNSVFLQAKSYLFIIIFSAFIMFPSFTFTSIFNSQGDTRTPMKIQVASLLLNMILDPIFIYYLGLGVAGAAVATTISYAFGLVIFAYFMRTRSYLHLTKKSFQYSKSIILEIIKVGAPATVLMLLLSIYIMFINKFMAHFGINYVASFGMVSRLETFAIMPIVASSIATLTLVGMFYGAKRYDLVKQTITHSLKISVIVTSIIGVLFFLLPSTFIKIFTPDVKLIELASAYLRINVFTFPLMAITMIVGRAMQGMGDGIPGLVINAVRIFVVAIPLSYLFVFVLGYGYLSISVALVLGGVASSAVGLAWLRFKFLKFLVTPSKTFK